MPERFKVVCTMQGAIQVLSSALTNTIDYRTIVFCTIVLTLILRIFDIIVAEEIFNKVYMFTNRTRHLFTLLIPYLVKNCYPLTCV